MFIKWATAAQTDITGGEMILCATLPQEITMGNSISELNDPGEMWLRF